MSDNGKALTPQENVTIAQLDKDLYAVVHLATEDGLWYYGMKTRTPQSGSGFYPSKYHRYTIGYETRDQALKAGVSAVIENLQGHADWHCGKNGEPFYEHNNEWKQCSRLLAAAKEYETKRQSKQLALF